jgi:hypothetical protein
MILARFRRRKPAERPARTKARQAVEKLQAGRPYEIFPGANGGGDYCPSCGHERQSRGEEWRLLSGECRGRKHVGRCLGCGHCQPFTADQARLWE